MKRIKNTESVFGWIRLPSLAGLLLCLLIIFVACNSPPPSAVDRANSLASEMNWLFGVLGFLGGLLLAAALGGGTLYLFNRRLQKIVAQRTAALQRSEGYYRGVFDNALNAILILDDDGNFVEANPAACRLLGYTQAELLRKRIPDIAPNIAPEDFPTIWQAFIDGGPQTGEIQLKGKSGQIIESEYQSVANFVPGRHLSIIHDITERKRTEQALRDSEAHFRAVWEIATDAMVLSDADGVVLDANPAYVKLYGYPLEAVVGQPFTTIYPPERQAAALNYYREVFAEPQIRPAYETSFSRPNGKRLYVESRIGFITNPEGQRTALLSIIRDITSHKETEAALRLSEERFKTIAKNAGMIVAQIDTELRYVWLYNPWPEFTSEDVIGKRDDELASHEGVEETMALKREVLATGVGKRQKITYNPEAGSLTYDVLAEPLYDAAGELIGLTTIGLDLTEQKRAEDRIRQLSQAVEQSPEAIIITNAQEEIEYVNPAFTTITGYSFAEARGRNPDFLGSGQTPAAVHEALHPTVLAGHTYRCEFINQKKSGELYWVQAVISPIKDEQGRITHLLAIEADITERKRIDQERARLEAHLRQSQRLETIGTLAGGIAHDFNNILTPIIGYTELALAALADDHPIHADLERVTNAAGRARDLVRQILMFSRQLEQERITIELQPLIKEVLTLLRPSLPATIEIRQEIAPDCGPILADPAQFNQVLMNLCTNAYQAMEQTGGVLTISLTQVLQRDLDPALKATLGQPAYACLRVTDTGHGMDTATLERAFEPFFTTKPPGQGTGLGLSVVHGIVNSHHGAIFASSEIGRGTTFELYFPISAIPTDVNAVTIEPPDRAVLERILVVDDEPIIVEMLGQWLTMLGYDVVEQTNSTDALNLYLKDTAHFDLVITDLTMPRMTGLQLAGQMTVLRPGLPIILITGNDNQLSQTDLDQNGINRVITKPVSFKRLNSVIRQLLN